ncbi:porin [Vibrio sp. SCSIO 43133]|uniref:porin n=1 Tax=Vibrio sp. SCSIO 43133 TaxID=2802577 RepID=UPI00207595CD|nr:porin [Vibrio sp. SCSIO 43133]USE03317.1 porin [Vibrio sp. SCSIO 43133]
MKSLFKLSTLAVSVFAASQVSAIELYNNEGTELTMYGAIAAQVSKYDYDKSTPMGSDDAYGLNGDSTFIEDPGSYVGFDISHTQGKFKGVAKIAFDVNFGTQTDVNGYGDSLEALTARQIYAGFGHEDFGTVTIGRQESPYMKTDKGYYSYWAGGLNMMQSDELGSRRAPNTVVWQNDFDNLYLGLQYQARRDVEQIAFGNGLNFGSFIVGGTLDSNFDLESRSKITIKDGFGGAIAYTFDFGTYVSAAYNQANDISGNFIDILGSATGTADNAEVKQYALAAEHHFMDGAISVSGRYEHFEAKDGSSSPIFDSKTDNFGLGANFYFTESMRIYGSYEYAKENNNLTGKTQSEANIYNIGFGWAPVAWGEVYLESYYDDVQLNDSINYETGAAPADTESKGAHFFLGAAVFF